jgi:UPF0755 protein
MIITKYNTFLKPWFDKVKTLIITNKKTTIYSLSVVVVLFILLLGYILLFSVPKYFPVGDVLRINQGDSLQSITVELKKNKIIRSELIFRSLVILFGGEKSVMAGDYLLSRKDGSLALATRFVKGEFGIDTVRITIPEGWNIFQIGEYLEKNLIKFNKKEFISKAKEYEGYLFPDTYFVSESAKPADIIEMMNENYKRKIASVIKIGPSLKTTKDIIIMASILEGEALPKDRPIVAGILWKRLSIGMPLQVDCTFSYINGKNTYELTLDDLKIDSPYNTYENKGLPPGPISNPGIDAITAAMSPVKSNYLYFLTEKDGTIHYAKTFAEHLKNKELYLR